MCGPGPTRAGRFGAGGRMRLSATLAVMAVLGAVAVGVASHAVADPDPGGVRSCPEGSLATSAIDTYAGAAAPGGASGGPAKHPDQGGRLPDARNTGAVALHGELVGRACFQRSGGRATVQFRWSSVGRILSGSFIYQLVDCTTGRTSGVLTRRLDYENGTRGTSEDAEATLTVNPSHQYRMRISGEGSYERHATGGFSGTIGYWSVAPGAGATWRSETTCA